jgi:hypothetical protein
VTKVVQPSHAIDGIVSDESAEFSVGERSARMLAQEPKDLIVHFETFAGLRNLVDGEPTCHVVGIANAWRWTAVQIRSRSEQIVLLVLTRCLV